MHCAVDWGKEGAGIFAQEPLHTAATPRRRPRRGSGTGRRPRAEGSELN
jgi:hypothetical protein